MQSKNLQYALGVAIESSLDICFVIVSWHAHVLQQHIGETYDPVTTQHQIHHLATNTGHRYKQRELLDKGLEILNHEAIDYTAKGERVKQKDHCDGVNAVHPILDGCRGPVDGSPVSGVRQQRERQGKCVHFSSEKSEGSSLTKVSHDEKDTSCETIFFQDTILHYHFILHYFLILSHEENYLNFHYDKKFRV